MLASFAFISTGLLVILFASSLNSLSKYKKSSLKQYSLAYVCLGLAFLGYGLAVVSKNPNALNFSLLWGNFFITLGSFAIIKERVRLKANAYYPIALAVSATVVVLRVVFFYPVAELYQGVLYFNTQLPVALFIAGLFLVVWIPSNIRLSKQIATLVKLPDAELIYTCLFTIAAMDSIFFIASKNRSSLILTFSVIFCCFFALFICNALIKNIRKV